MIYDTEKQQILASKRLNQQFFGFYLLFFIYTKKRLKQLMDYQNSWQLIFYRSLNALLVQLLQL